MVSWLNHAAIEAPRNATTTHTVTPSAGTAVAGTLFTPTAGRFLMCVVEGSVTSTTPTNWTLPTGGSAVNNTGLYVWYRASAAGNDSITTTHNGSNYDVIFDFYEFPSGTTFSGSAAATAVSPAGGAGPTLSGLSGTNWVAGAAAQAGTGATRAFTWSTGVTATSFSVANGATTGYTYSLTYLEDYASATASAAATSATTPADTVERLMFAVKIPTVAVLPLPDLHMAPRR